MLFLLLSIVAVAAIFYYYIYRPMNYWKDRGVEQGNPKWIFGHFWDNFTGKNGCDVYDGVYKQSPNARYTGMYQFSEPILILRDPQLLKTITIKDFDSFMDHAEILPPELDILFGKTLLNLKGQTWRDMRAALSPSFTSSKMRTIYALMMECAENMTQHLLRRVEETSTFNMKDVFSRYTNDVIATTAFGVKVDSWRDPDNKFYEIANEMADQSKNNIKLILHYFIPAVKYFINVKLTTDQADSFIRTLIDDTIRAREEKGIIRPDMLHLLLQTRNNLRKQKEKAKEANDSGHTPNGIIDITNEDIAANGLIFIFAGFETVSTTLSFVTYELALNSDIQERLRQEVQATRDQYGEKVTYEAIQEMKYMDMVMSETLRKWPHFVFTDRICTKPYTIDPETSEEKPIHLKKGSKIGIPIYSIQRDPKYYPEPERFDPERFDEDNKGNIQPYTYLPFGLGPRNCIGSRFAVLECKIILFHLLSHFELVPVSKTTIPVELEKKALFNLKPVDGVWIGFNRLKELHG